MCDRKCICKDCINNCNNCKYNFDVIDQCRNNGVESCNHFKAKKIKVKDDKPTEN